MVTMLTIALILSLATVEGGSHINNNNGNYDQRDLRANNNGGYYNQGGQNINNVGFNNQRITNVNNGYYQHQGNQIAQNNVGYNQGNLGGSSYGTGSAGTRGRQFSGNNYNNRVDSPGGSASFRRNPVSPRNNVYSNGNQGIGHGTARTGGGYAGNNVGNVGGYASNNVGTGSGHVGDNFGGNNVGNVNGYASNNVGTGGYASNNVGTVGDYAGNNVGISSGHVGNNAGGGGGYAGNNVGRRDRTRGINFGTSVNVNTDYQNNNQRIPSSTVYSSYNVSPFGNTGNQFRNPNSVGGNFGGNSFNAINSGVHGNGNGGIIYVGNNGISGNVYQGNRGNIQRGGNAINGYQGIYTGVNRGGNSNINLGNVVGPRGQTSYGGNTRSTRGISGRGNSVGGNGHIGNGYNVNTLAGNGHNIGITGLGNGIINGNNNINRIHSNVGIHSTSGTNAASGGQSYHANSGATGLHVSRLTGAGNVIVNGNRGNTGILHGNNVNAGLAFGNNVNGGLSNSNNAFARNNDVVNRGSISVSRRPPFVNTVGFGGQRNTGKRLDQGGQSSFGKRDYSSFGNRNTFRSPAHLGGRVNALQPSNFRGNVRNSARTGAVVGRGPFNVHDGNSGNRYVTAGNQGPGVDGSSYQNGVNTNVPQTYTSINNNNLVHNANAATGGSGSAASGGNIYVNPRRANTATGGSGSGSAASGGIVYVNPRSVHSGNVQGKYPDRNTGTLGANGQVNPGHPQGSSRTDILNTPAAANVAFNTSGAVGGGSDAVNSNCFKDVDISNDYSSSSAGMPRQRIVDELERRPFLRSAMGINGAFIANEFDLLSEPGAPSRFQGSSKTSSLGDDFRFDTSDGFFVDSPDTGTTSGRIRDLRARQLERLQPLLKARSQVCPSNRRPLRSFNMGNQQCFTVNKKNQPTMFATCTRRNCPRCSRGQGVGRCTEVFEKATVFAWCDDNSFSDKIRRMSLLVPKYCSGMSYDC